MKRPQSPPDLADLWVQLVRSERLSVAFREVAGPLVNGKYRHWDKLRYLQPPGDLSHAEWWAAVKWNRQSQYREVPLRDTNGARFIYLLCEPIPERLHQIDQSAAGRIQMPEPITNLETKEQYLVGSLMEEAITSSQLEGAATTRQIAKEMIRTGRAPRDASERMILNNFRTMQHIGKLKEQSLTPELLFDIHRRVTHGTLEDSSAAGRFRRLDERIDVGDDYGSVFHVPPPAEELARRTVRMCKFANGLIPEEFMHPVIRSIILHFWLAYDHPFTDGNGRTARALFYWSMLRHGYWLCEFISISEVIRKSATQYGRAFLYTETDDNDLTYFLLYHLKVIRRAIDQLHKYISRKTRELQALEAELRGMTVLNHRQRALIGHALRHPQHRYAIESHRRSHNVVYETARTDLLKLAERGLLQATKIGREWQFTPVRDLEQRLRELS